ncbi:MAG: phosphatase domain-containing protein [Planctomycetota bacterium]
MVANFSWIIKDRVAGMARPRPTDLEWLRDQGVSAVVSLTEVPPPGIEAFEHFHLPIPDMTSPTLDELRTAIVFIQERADNGVVVHCGAGLGRTGTVLAAYLVSRGESAPGALERVRAMRPGSVETPDQEQVITRYAELVGGVAE